MIKAFKYRIYPTRKQAAALQFTLDRNRALYIIIGRSLRETASSGTFQEATA
ncbi:MAG TPA: helix-turn-helix domain-containing protein [Ktedonobacteraceae bacterium]|nr:helix-turn-helix domain-containing protein [Ktedonobacteraceae bacterium]